MNRWVPWFQPPISDALPRKVQQSALRPKDPNHPTHKGIIWPYFRRAFCPEPEGTSPTDPDGLFTPQRYISIRCPLYSELRNKGLSLVSLVVEFHPPGNPFFSTMTPMVARVELRLDYGNEPSRLEPGWFPERKSPCPKPPEISLAFFGL